MHTTILLFFSQLSRPRLPHDKPFTCYRRDRHWMLCSTVWKRSYASSLNSFCRWLSSVVRGLEDGLWRGLGAGDGSGPMRVEFHRSWHNYETNDRVHPCVQRYIGTRAEGPVRSRTTSAPSLKCATLYQLTMTSRSQSAKSVLCSTPVPWDVFASCFYNTRLHPNSISWFSWYTLLSPPHARPWEQELPSQ